MTLVSNTRFWMVNRGFQQWDISEWWSLHAA